MNNLRFHPTPVGRAVINKTNSKDAGGEGVVAKEELLFTSDGLANYYSLYGNYCGDSSENLRMKLPYDPALASLAHTQRTL